MDYIGVLKRAWSVTWRYRILWLFGLFAGGAGSSGGGGGNYSLGQGDIDPGMTREFERAWWWVQDNLPLLIAAAAFLFFIGLALFVISIAAKGGLVHLVNEAEEERPVRGFDGWSAGFRMWLRVLAIALILFTPIVLTSILLIVAVLAPIIGPLVSGGEPGAEAVLGLCGGLLFGGLFLVLASILAGVLDTLAVRHAVLADAGVFRSIGEAWTDVRTRFKDVAVMWLLMFAVGIAYGIAVGVVTAVFGVGIAMAALGGAWLLAGLVGFVLFVALLLPTAIYSAFSSAAWTVFYRRLTGREVVAAPAGPGVPLPPGHAPAAAPAGAPLPPTPPAPGAVPPTPPTPPPPAPPAPPAPPGPSE